MYSLSSRFAFLAAWGCCLLIACSSGATSEPRWTTTQVIAAFQNAGLSVDQVHVPDAGEGLPADSGADVVAFHITDSDGDATGYIFSLHSSTAAQQLKQTNPSLSQPSAPGFVSLTFTHDNVYVMLLGSVPEATLRKYEEAVKTLR